MGGISPLQLQIDVLVSRGIKRVILVVGYRGDDVRRAAIARAAGRLEIVPVWNPFWSVTNVIGSAWMARDHLDGPFVYLHADTVFDPTILDDLLASTEDGSLPVDLRACEPEQMKAAIVDGRITHLSKELDEADTAGEFIGIAAFRTPALPYLKAGLDAVLADGLLSAYFEAALNRAIDDGLVLRPIPTAGRPWTEIDFPADLELARAMLPRFRT